MKKTLKKVLPGSVLRKISDKKNEAQVTRYDKKRFRENRLHGLSGATKSQIEGKLIFHAHALEKGLSRDNIRLGFGERALKGLRDAMFAYRSKGYSEQGEIYSNALSTLKAYIDLHESRNFDVTYLEDIFGKDITQSARDCVDESGGAMIVEAANKKQNKTKNFRDLFTERVSVRSYAETSVDLKKVRNAIALSMKAPSVCNRQSSRVHVFTDKKAMTDVLKLQGGLAGYDTPPLLLMITTDTSAFLAPAERNQIYTDGGLFAMALMLALEYEGLAACPLNAMLSVKREKGIRKIVGLPDNENIVMFLSVGNFKDENNVPKSFRVKADSVTVER